VEDPRDVGLTGDSEYFGSGAYCLPIYSTSLGRRKACVRALAGIADRAGTFKAKVPGSDVDGDVNDALGASYEPEPPAEY